MSTESGVKKGPVQRQDEPDSAACPNCGGEPEYNPQHNLRKLGYPHDDIVFTCSECSKQWTCGVPEKPNEDDDFRCNACWKGDEVAVYGRPNWVHYYPEDEAYHFHLKCPRCYHVFGPVVREAVIREKNDIASTMVGDPAVSGRLDEGRQPFRTRD